MVSWTESTDYIRCHPEFHGNPRYDYVIFRTVQGEIFGKLILMFSIVIEGKDYPIALVQPYDAPIGRIYSKDIDLGFMRVKAKPRASSEFISVRTIIRGAVLVPDFEKDGEFIVMDILDNDMFLRVKQMQY